MAEVVAETFTQVVLLAALRGYKAMLRAAAPARSQHFTLLTGLRQAGKFIPTELFLLRGINHLRKAVLMDIAEMKFGVNIVIAGINITIVLNDDRAPAGGLMVTHRSGRANKVGEGPFNVHHENFTDVALNPTVKNRGKKLTIGFRANGPGRCLRQSVQYLAHAGTDPRWIPAGQPAARRPG